LNLNIVADTDQLEAWQNETAILQNTQPRSSNQSRHHPNKKYAEQEGLEDGKNADRNLNSQKINKKFIKCW
jgi:hypothetical protein